MPLYNGFSGHAAPHYYAMRRMMEDSDPRILPVLAARGPLGIVVDHAGDADGALRKLVLAVPGARVDRMEPDWSSYVLPRNEAPPDVAERSGTPIGIKSLSTGFNPDLTRLTLDDKLDTRWSGGVKRASDITLELDAPGRVAQVVTAMGGAVTDYPEQLLIEVSPDGSQWETVFLGDTGCTPITRRSGIPRRFPSPFASTATTSGSSG